MKADLIITNIGQLVTCASPSAPKRGKDLCEAGIVENGGIAIRDGSFIGVGRADDILATFESDEQIDAGNAVVCPGFVDPHTHIVYAGNRLNEFELKLKGVEYLDILAAGGGIISTVRNTRAAQVEELVDLGRMRLDKMLESGTTTTEIKTGYGLDTENELKMLAVIEELDRVHPIDIVPTFLAAHAVPPEFKNNADGYIDLVCREMLPLAWKWFATSRFHGRTPFYCDVFIEKNAFDLQQAKKMIETARSLGFGIKAHVDQFTNLGGTRLAIGSGAVSVDHLDAISDDEVEQLAASGSIGIILPTENFNAAKAVFTNARQLIDEGCAVAISTDYNPGSSPCLSQAMAMAIACRFQKLLPAEALNAATLNSSFAIGMAKEVGSIEVGKQADLILFDTNDYRSIAYEFGTNLVRAVYKRGILVHSADSKL
jgi:imidazolonepropionase